MKSYLLSEGKQVKKEESGFQGEGHLLAGSLVKVIISTNLSCNLLSRIGMNEVVGHMKQIWFGQMSIYSIPIINPGSISEFDGEYRKSKGTQQAGTYSREGYLVLFLVL